MATTFPPRPAEGDDPWFETRETYDEAIEQAINDLEDGDGSPMRPHATKEAGRNSGFPKNFWQYEGDPVTDIPDNFVTGDEWIYDLAGGLVLRVRP